MGRGFEPISQLIYGVLKCQRIEGRETKDSAYFPPDFMGLCQSMMSAVVLWPRVRAENPAKPPSKRLTEAVSHRIFRDLRAISALHVILRIDVMKVRNSLKSAKNRDKNCVVVRRKGRVYVINKRNPRFKARQG